MLFSKEWFQKHQKILLFFTNTWLGRKVLCIDGEKSSVGKYKIIKIEPNAIWWIAGRDLKIEFRTHYKFAKRLYYSFKPLWYLIHAWDTLIANNFQPAWNLGFDTFYPDAHVESNSVDGGVARGAVDEPFATIRAGAGVEIYESDTSQVHVGMMGGATTDYFRWLHRSFYLFLTSSLPDGDAISSAVLSIFGNNKANTMGSPEMDIVSSTPASNTALATGDFGSVGTTVYASITYNNWSTTAYNDFTLSEAGIATISKTGVSKFGGRVNWDTDNSFGGTYAQYGWSNFQGYFADQTGTDNDPKLVVTYVIPSILKNSFIKLQAVSRASTY